jgi:hypothetical protein
MFKEEYLLELLSGRLSKEGYANIIGSITSLVKRNHWQKSIIISDSLHDEWRSDDIEELAHMYLEWVIANDKLKYLSRIPYEYLSYYFTQMLVSFVADRIKLEQQKKGVSFQKCQELVKTICEEDYEILIQSGKAYVKSQYASASHLTDDFEDAVKYLPHIRIDESTKQVKPLIRIAIEDILLSIDCYLSVESLCKATFVLLDQSTIATLQDRFVEQDEFDNETKYKNAINDILTGVSPEDASIYLDYIFQKSGALSLAEISAKYSIPRSTAHKQIENFKQKVFYSYMPDSESDGVTFLQNLANALDNISK